MRKLQVITLFTIFLMAISASNLVAQRREPKTGGAKAAYGYPSEHFSTKKKKSKRKKKHPKARPPKSAKPLFEKRNPWAN